MLSSQLDVDKKKCFHLIKTIKNETNEPISLLSPMQHNELVQTLRKVVISDENIDLGTVWTAAIKDGEISYAQLGSAMSSVKKKGFEGIRKGSPEYKQKIKILFLFLVRGSWFVWDLLNNSRNCARSTRIFCSSNSSSELVQMQLEPENLENLDLLLFLIICFLNLIPINSYK